MTFFLLGRTPPSPPARRSKGAPTDAAPAITAAIEVACGLFLALLLLGPQPKRAEAQIAVRSSLAHDFEVEPGGRASGEIRVENRGEDTAEARLYLRDYTFDASGNVEYGPAGSEPRSLARWLTFSPQRIRLRPGETRTAVFEIDLPSEAKIKGQTAAEPEGTFWSMIMVEGTRRRAPPENKKEGQVAFAQKARYGVQVAAHLPDGASALSFSRPSFSVPGAGSSPQAAGLASQAGAGSASPPPPALEFSLSNEGARMAEPDIWVEVYERESGTKIGRYRAGKEARLYPGTASRYAVPLPGLEPGKVYRAVAVAETPRRNPQGRRFTLDYESPPSGEESSPREEEKQRPKEKKPRRPREQQAGEAPGEIR